MNQLPLYPELFLEDLANQWYMDRDADSVESISEYFRRSIGWNRNETTLWRKTGHIPVWWCQQTSGRDRTS